ncbi:MAG: homoserine dehydrogenase [bacterium]|nr:homoserine dehydrogenase [bacterium]
MSSERLIVLKFGGSVLKDEEAARLAVHEIYRWRRRGYQVVAVVSALAGTTDALLAKARGVCAAPSPESVAAVVSNGELASAALLGLHLDRAGVPASVLTPAAIDLVAVGDPLDAEPVGVDVQRLRRPLAAGGVVVVPGYVACDGRGRTVVLGRGGSDTTAIFLAAQLGATRCRLIKDVDGLYERDPAAESADSAPRRYASVSWDDALQTDGSILQHKALRFARELGLVFDLGRFNGTRPTEVGPGPTRFASSIDATKELSVCLLGAGTVGEGVWTLFRELGAHVNVQAVAVRDAERRRAVPADQITTDLETAAGSGADVVIEAIGGVDRARHAIECALRAGSHVVTANKAVLAAAGSELAALARECGRELRFSASVGGSMPLLEHLASFTPGAVRAVHGVLNATTNFVVNRVADGLSLDAALAEARQRGLAESDTERDLSGLDAADKLCVIAQQLGWPALALDRVRRRPIDARTLADAGVGRGGTTVRHVAYVERSGDEVLASVAFRETGPADPLAVLPDAQNAAVIELTDGTRQVVRGKGAGRWPTAEAVVADVLAIARTLERRTGDAAEGGGLSHAG